MPSSALAASNVVEVKSCAAAIEFVGAAGSNIFVSSITISLSSSDETQFLVALKLLFPVGWLLHSEQSGGDNINQPAQAKFWY